MSHNQSRSEVAHGRKAGRSAHLSSAGSNNRSNVPSGGPSPELSNHGGKKINGVVAGKSNAAASSGTSEPVLSCNMQNASSKTGSKSAKQTANPAPPKPSRSGIPSTNIAVTASESVSSIPTMGRLGDVASKNEAPAFIFQFGSISPGFMPHPGIQLPARTSSAPPNLNEQKLEQARFEGVSGGGLANVPTPTPITQPTGPGKQKPQEVKQPTISKATTTTTTPTTTATIVPPVASQSIAGTSMVSPTPHPYQGGQHSLVSLHMQVPPHLMVPQGLQPTQGYRQTLTHSGPGGPGQIRIPTPSMPPQLIATTGSQYPNQYIQPRANRAVKIVNPDTHEEVVFDAKSREGDQFNNSLHVRAPSPVNYSAGGGMHHLNAKYYPLMQTGRYSPSGGQAFFHPPTNSVPSITHGLPNSSGLLSASKSEVTSVGGANLPSPAIVTASSTFPSPYKPSDAIAFPDSKPKNSSSTLSEPQESIVEKPRHVETPPSLEVSLKVVGTPKQLSSGSSLKENGRKSSKREQRLQRVSRSTISSLPELPDTTSPKPDVLSIKDAVSPAVEKVHLGASIPVLSSVKSSVLETGNANANVNVGGSSLKTSSAKIEGSKKKPILKKKSSNVSLLGNDLKIPAEIGPASKDVVEDLHLSVEETVQNSSNSSSPHVLSENLQPVKADEMSEEVKLVQYSDIAAGKAKPNSNNSRLISDREKHVTSEVISVDAVVEAKELDPFLDSKIDSEISKLACLDSNIPAMNSMEELRRLPEKELSGEETASTSPGMKETGVAITTIPSIQIEVEAAETLQEIDSNGSKSTETGNHDEPLSFAKAADSVLTQIKAGDLLPSDEEVSEETEMPSHGHLVEIVAGDQPTKSDSHPLDTKDRILVDNPTRAKDPISNSRSFSTSMGMASSGVKVGSKKKKKKELLAKADAAGSTADLYNAYKTTEESRPEEGRLSKGGSKLTPVTPVSPVEEKAAAKEPDDWEDATVELASPGVFFAPTVPVVVGNCKYSRDFMLTLRNECQDLPFDFHVRHEFFDLLANPQTLMAIGELEGSGNLGRQSDLQLSSGSMHDRRNGNLAEEERWGKQVGMGPQGQFMGPPGGGGYRSNIEGARTPNTLRSGMLPGIGLVAPVPSPMSGMVSTHCLTRSSSDTDRWMRSPLAHKGLMPSPQYSLPPIHKTENRYEVGKVTDDEEIKQRQVKGILNKLTPQNFEKLFDQVKEVKIGSAHTLTGVISQIFDKALTEPTFCEMYAQFCVQLAVELPEFNEDGVKVTFKRVLLNKCQEEFERGQREQAEADMIEEDGEVQITTEEREAKQLKARRRMLGNIRFIGELYKKNMLTERIMHECIQTLLGEYQNPDEEAVESLCKLMATIGQRIDHAKAKEHMEAYFDRLTKMSINPKLSLRIRFMLKDILDLRRMGWQERRKIEGPKKIKEVHWDAVQEHQQVTRMPRGSNSGSLSGRRVQGPPDFSMRGSNSQMLSSPSAGGGLRGSQSLSQAPMRGPYSQDARLGAHQISDNKSKPTHLSQHPSDDATIMLGPQGGWNRIKGMRGQAITVRSVLADTSSGDVRRLYHTGPISDRTTSIEREEITFRSHDLEKQLSMSDRGVLDRTDLHGIGAGHNLERAFSDKSMRTALYSDIQQLHSLPATPLASPNTSAYAMPKHESIEEKLKNKSEMTLREYFSARDLKEAAQCVREQECPEFHSAMVSAWISLSMEGKTVDRDLELLADLIAYLSKNEPLLKQEHVLKGFKLVLLNLEDTLVDVPRAPDYLARLLGKLIAEDIFSLVHVSKILRDSAAEVEGLMEGGICLRIFAGSLDAVQRVATSGAMLNLYRASNLHIEEFVLLKDRNKGFLESTLKDPNLLHILQTLENQA